MIAKWTLGLCLAALGSSLVVSARGPESEAARESFAVSLTFRWHGPFYLPTGAVFEDPDACPPDTAFNAGNYNINGGGQVVVTARQPAISVVHNGPDKLIVSSQNALGGNYLIIFGPGSGRMRLVSLQIRIRSPGDATGTYQFITY